MPHLTRQQHAQAYSESKFGMKKKLLSLGYTMHWEAPRCAEEVVMPRWQVCKNRIDAFMLAHGSIKKTMDAMSAKELAQAITQMQIIVKDFLKKV